jgi:adenylylsulfate kinase
MKILIFGLPGSGKSTLAEPLAKLLGGVHINADRVREKYEGHDMSKWDFSPQGRMLQAQRMKFLSDGVVMAGKIAVADFVCPTAEAREQFGPDFTVFMDTIEQGRYEDTNKMFQRPDTHWAGVDYHVAKWFDDTHSQLVPVIERFMKKQNTTPVGYSAWRMEQAENV